MFYVIFAGRIDHTQFIYADPGGYSAGPSGAAAWMAAALRLHYSGPGSG